MAAHSGASLGAQSCGSLATAAEPHERGSPREVHKWFAVGSEQAEGVEVAQGREHDMRGMQ